MTRSCYEDSEEKWEGERWTLFRIWDARGKCVPRRAPDEEKSRRCAWAAPLPLPPPEPTSVATRRARAQRQDI
jgi:hypothetical protein